jgi:peptidoglycan L-alanyl-D-glutamate endopeptidase CwlK
MSRLLNDLSPRFRPLAIELIARCVEQGIAVLIVNTLRTPEEQAENIRKGVSWTVHSRHLTGDAIDLVPYEVYTLAPGGDKAAWNAHDSVWSVMGHIGESLGLKWGGRWKQRDMGHFEYPETDTTIRA